MFPNSVAFKKLYSKEALMRSAPGLLLFAFMLIAHALMDCQPGDYLDLRVGYEGHGLVEYLSQRWAKWTSRIILEGLIIPLSPAAWAVVDSFMFVLIWHAFLHITETQKDNQMRWAVCALVLCYPLVEQSSAGWIMTTGMYIWPLALGLYAISIVARAVRKEAVGIVRIVLGCIATLVAANQEQMAAILAGVLLVMLAWEALRKRFHPFMVAMLAVVFADIALTLACPGNSARLSNEIAYWMPSFASYTPLHKLYLGITDTLDRYVYEGIVPSLLLAGTLAVAVFVDKKSPLWSKALAIAPLAIIVAGSWLAPALDVNLHYLVERFLARPDLQAGGRNLGSLATGMILAFCIAATCVKVFGWNRKGWLMLAILCAGFASRIMMGFSPTLFGSGDRTFVFFDFTMLLVAAYSLKEIRDRSTKAFDNTLLALAIVAAACAADSLSAATLCDFIER